MGWHFILVADQQSISFRFYSRQRTKVKQQNSVLTAVNCIVFLFNPTSTRQGRTEVWWCPRRILYCTQGRNEVRWRPGQETSLAPPCSNLRSFGSKSAVEESTCDIVRTFRRPRSDSATHNDLAPGDLRSPCSPDCEGRRKIQTMSQVLSSMQYICFRKTYVRTGGRQMASCPGRHLTSLRPYPGATRLSHLVCL